MQCINCNFNIPDTTDDYYNAEHTELECPKCNYIHKLRHQDRENGQVDTLVKCRMYIEHEHFCLRDDSDFLLWYCKLTDLEHGVEFKDMTTNALKLYKERLEGI